MGRIIINENILNKLKLQTYYGSGNFADVFEYDQDNIVKLWNKEAISYKDNERLLYSMVTNELDKIKSDIFMFPKHFLFCSDEFVGIVRKKVEGMRLQNDFLLNLDLEDLYILLVQIKKEIMYLSSKYDLRMYDIKFANMVYNTDLEIINIIDTDFYYRDTTSLKEDIFNSNMKLFNKAWLIKFAIIQIVPFINNNRVKNMLSNVMLDNGDFSDLIYTILEEKDSNINNLSDVKRYTLI